MPLPSSTPEVAAGLLVIVGLAPCGLCANSAETGNDRVDTVVAQQLSQNVTATSNVATATPDGTTLSVGPRTSDSPAVKLKGVVVTGGRLPGAAGQLAQGAQIETLNDFARQSWREVHMDSKDAIDKLNQAVPGTYLPWIALADPRLKYECLDAGAFSVRIARSDSISAIEPAGLNPTTDLPGVGRARVAAPLHTGEASSPPEGQSNPAPEDTPNKPEMLDRVVVTALKRTEWLEEIPVAAQVVSARELALANATDLSDLNKLVPSVQLNGTINGRVPIGIRGISSVSNEGTVGIASGVAIMIDGVPVPSDSFAANNLIGFQSVEVLLGPQSTLGGRTAASGLINLTTRGPTDSPYAFVNTTVTNDREYSVEGFLSGPITYGVEGSLDAYSRRTPYPITNLTLDKTTTQDVNGVRGKLKFTITDDLDLTLMGHYENTVSTGFNFVYIYITPGNTFLFPGSPFTQAVMLPGIKLSWRNLDYTSPVSTAGSTYRDTDYSAIVNYRLPGGYSLTSTTARTQEDQHSLVEARALYSLIVKRFVHTYYAQQAAARLADIQARLQNVPAAGDSSAAPLTGALIPV